MLPTNFERINAETLVVYLEGGLSDTFDEWPPFITRSKELLSFAQDPPPSIDSFDCYLDLRSLLIKCFIGNFLGTQGSHK